MKSKFNFSVIIKVLIIIIFVSINIFTYNKLVKKEETINLLRQQNNQKKR